MLQERKFEICCSRKFHLVWRSRTWDQCRGPSKSLSYGIERKALSKSPKKPMLGPAGEAPGGGIKASASAYPRQPVCPSLSHSRGRENWRKPQEKISIHHRSFMVARPQFLALTYTMPFTDAPRCKLSQQNFGKMLGQNFAVSGLYEKPGDCVSAPSGLHPSIIRLCRCLLRLWRRKPVPC